jgi:hypothetical protein
MVAVPPILEASVSVITKAGEVGKVYKPTSPGGWLILAAVVVGIQAAELLRAADEAAYEANLREREKDPRYNPLSQRYGQNDIVDVFEKDGGVTSFLNLDLPADRPWLSVPEWWNSIPNIVLADPLNFTEEWLDVEVAAIGYTRITVSGFQADLMELSRLGSCVAREKLVNVPTTPSEVVIEDVKGIYKYTRLPTGCGSQVIGTAAITKNGTIRELGSASINTDGMGGFGPFEYFIDTDFFDGTAVPGYLPTNDRAARSIRPAPASTSDLPKEATAAPINPTQPAIPEGARAAPDATLDKATATAQKATATDAGAGAKTGGLVGAGGNVGAQTGAKAAAGAQAAAIPGVRPVPIPGVLPPVVAGPVPQTPVGSEIVAGVPIGVQAPAATLVGIAAEVGRIEQKVASVMDALRVANPSWLEDLLQTFQLLKTLYDFLTGTSQGGTYELTSKCEKDAQGELIIKTAEFPATDNSFDEISVKIDAIAELLQHSKDLKQPMCVEKIPHGNVTLTAWETLT